jgi:hypothetical protein
MTEGTTSLNERGAALDAWERVSSTALSRGTRRTIRAAPSSTHGGSLCLSPAQIVRWHLIDAATMTDKQQWKKLQRMRFRQSSRVVSLRIICVELATVRQNDGPYLFLCKTGAIHRGYKKNSRSYGTGFLEIRRGAMTTDLRTVFIGLAMVVFVFAVAMGIHFASKV